jgi:hypothetical protein|tara:strand:- start:381 stop:605 length:225 start_codon:yes stop_codon:yes gene_type:complete
MPVSIEWLSRLPAKEQEKILKSLSNAEELKPIEVDGVVYHVPGAVIGLIDSLWMQIQEGCKTGTYDLDSGIEKN